MIRLQPVALPDREFLYRLACDPLARQWSFEPQPPTPRQHADWFRAWLQREDCLRWIILSDTQRAGLVWAERVAPHAARISINLVPGLRLRGIGTAALEQAVSAVRADWDALILAYIKPGNVVSERCFVKAGFARAALTVSQKGQEAILYARD